MNKTLGSLNVLIWVDYLFYNVAQTFCSFPFMSSLDLYAYSKVRFCFLLIFKNIYNQNLFLFSRFTYLLLLDKSSN